MTCLIGLSLLLSDWIAGSFASDEQTLIKNIDNTNATSIFDLVKFKIPLLTICMQ